MNTLKNIADNIASFLDNKKAEDITVYHVTEKNWLTDFIIVFNMKNAVHGKAISKELVNHLSSVIVENPKEFYNPIRLSGSADTGWIIMDINSIVVHCFDAESRDFYNLDSILEKQGDVFHY
ncbi:ribosome silencing factor [Candidatus Marinamargulisbacteria bacterium SCGC AG-343-D04]|nr:ribosome silencing factor [Candidatus Marinamargulisbacteria bacterium SCGC AG-343-D04]